MYALGKILRVAMLTIGFTLTAVWSTFLALELFKAFEFLISPESERGVTLVH
jgi:hypothetical protein